MKIRIRLRRSLRNKKQIMKKIIFTIPHYYKKHKDSDYGSGRETEEQRVNALSKTIHNIDKNFGKFSKIIICTSGKYHLIGKLPKEIRGKIIHKQRNLKDPMYLGFECQDILLENIKNYDYFCYLEDDLLIEDKKFFDKLELFNKRFGLDFLLQPNLFEYNPEYIEKYYPNKIVSVWKSKTLELRDGDKKICLINSWREHSGCYFLNKHQMQKISKSESFGKRTDKYIGPLESAASYSIKENFIIYKPSFLNRSWLELRHVGDRYLKDYINDGGEESWFYFYRRLKEIILSVGIFKFFIMGIRAFFMKEMRLINKNILKH